MSAAASSVNDFDWATCSALRAIMIPRKAHIVSASAA